MIWEILTGILAIVGIILAIWATKSEKGKKYLEAYNEVKGQIEYYIKVAEQFEKATGAEKKKFVIDTVMGYIEYHKLPISKEIVEQILEAIIDLTKKVNSK